MPGCAEMETGKMPVLHVEKHQEIGRQQDQCDDTRSVGFELEEVGFCFHGSIQSPARKLRELKNLRRALRKSFPEIAPTKFKAS